MAAIFDISPEKRASQLHFFYRQLFVTAPPVSQRDVDLNGKTAIVTGSNGGVGLEIARQLLDLNCKVILAVRDEAKGDRARQDLTKGRVLPSDFVEVWRLDLSSYDSITAFARRARSLSHLDITVLNAGLYKGSESFSSTGFEEDVQINYLSNILLLIVLLPIIKEKKMGDIGYINLLSSDIASWCKFNERNSSPLLSAFKQKAARWDMADRYGTSKLLGQLFLTELSKHISPSVVTISCANPGFCDGSDLARDVSGPTLWIHKVMKFLLSHTCAVGARSPVHAVATLGQQSHGQYVEDAKVQPMAPIVYTAEGQRLAKRLYEETLDELTFAGVKDIVDEISKFK